ncbi:MULTISPECIES: polysaccharide biosynthesis/export family protein [unclassified Ruegeria]|uniref:polysaccharide biosynthesis/export family protein n=1 Tax=unclassified Ruegeria TaxID=2625375 RepID=UPI001ADAD2DC|nr:MULTISPECIES: polysaccharide biosynthesis/export family protein [unclassified Ruegeria]MBO9412083.1 polysaccharide biosynthesis/export family protein [Ruegeria sp. R8_1]MBO9417192.1 polysaccharide biosynthesis/export family protein [Ruegeria sp. R8_2]
MKRDERNGDCGVQRAKAIRLLSGVILGLSLSQLVATTAAADFDLEPGDEVTVAFTGLEDLSFDATIDAHGDVNLKWLGQFQAQGRSTDELEQLVRLDAAGKIVKQYDQNGEIYIIQLDGDEIEIVRNGYRPIIVGGDVAQTGQIDFRVAITAREAVALAGGVRSRLLTDDITIDPIQLLRWQTAYGQAALKHAEGIVTAWRASSEIAQDMDLLPPVETAVSVSPKVLSELVAEQIRIRKINQENEAGEREFFTNAKKQASERIRILEEQKTELAKALKADEEEEARVVSLVEKGLAPGSRLADTRRTTVLSATRLLDVEEDLAGTSLIMTRLIRDQEQYEQERSLRLLQERRAATLDVRDARHQMDTISKYLAGASDEIGTESLIMDIDYTVTVFRMVDGQLQSREVDKLTQLLPGDSLEISVQEIAPEPPLTE